MRSVRVLLVIGLLAAACGNSVERTVAVDIAEDYEQINERIPLEGVLYAAPLLIEGTVLKVAGPFWNQPDGQKWELTEEDRLAMPGLYREVSLDVTKVWRNDIEFTPFMVEYGDEVAETTTTGAVKYAALRTIDLDEPFLFVVDGSGVIPDEGSYESADYSIPSGYVREGDRVIVALMHSAFPMRHRQEPLYQAISGLDGVWTVVERDQNSWVVPSYTLHSPPTTGQGDPMPLGSYGTPLHAFTALFESARQFPSEEWDRILRDPWDPERSIRFGWILVEDPERYGSDIAGVRTEVEASLSPGDLVPLVVVQAEEQPAEEGGEQ